MNRIRVLSLALAGLTTGVLLLWANMEPTGPLMNATWLIFGISGAFIAIWLAWRPRSHSFHEVDGEMEHSYTER